MPSVSHATGHPGRGGDQGAASRALGTPRASRFAKKGYRRRKKMLMEAVKWRIGDSPALERSRFQKQAWVTPKLLALAPLFARKSQSLHQPRAPRQLDSRGGEQLPALWSGRVIREAGRASLARAWRQLWTLARLERRRRQLWLVLSAAVASRPMESREASQFPGLTA